MPSTPVHGNVGSVIVSLPVTLPLHASCPPEERTFDDGDDLERDQDDLHAPRQASRRASFEHEDDCVAGAEVEEAESPGRRVHDLGGHDRGETASPAIAEDDIHDHETRLAQSLSATALSPRLPYEKDPPVSHPERVLPNSSSSYLQPGSKFVGTQQSDRQVYNVQVEIKYVDMEESFLCGYLRIQGLTDDHPTLTTYFEGEIIGNKHTFKTTHPEWGSSEKVDMQHWNRFPAWRPLAKQAKSPSFTFKNYAQREHLFMRWKEYFLVPDHKVKTISGASFEGFYYICFNQCSGSVSGIYFHAKSEKFQKLELEHVNDRGCASAMEFR